MTVIYDGNGTISFIGYGLPFISLRTISIVRYATYSNVILSHKEFLAVLYYENNQKIKQLELFYNKQHFLIIFW